MYEWGDAASWEYLSLNKCFSQLIFAVIVSFVGIIYVVYSSSMLENGGGQNTGRQATSLDLIAVL